MDNAFVCDAKQLDQVCGGLEMVSGVSGRRFLASLCIQKRSGETVDPHSTVSPIVSSYSRPALSIKIGRLDNLLVPVIQGPRVGVHTEGRRDLRPDPQPPAAILVELRRHQLGDS